MQKKFGAILEVPVKAALGHRHCFNQGVQTELALTLDAQGFNG